LLDVDGYKVNVLTLGTLKPGVPAVIFESGLGSTLDTWGTTLTEIAASTRVVAYERAGIGASEPRPEPRTFTQIVRELRGLLEKTGIPAPYVLVGHSLGGAIVHAFALSYPEEVAGIVYLDSSDFMQSDEPGRPKEGKDAMRALQNARRATWPAGVRAEAVGLRPLSEGFAKDLGVWNRTLDIPVTILIAGRCDPPVSDDDRSEEAATWRKAFAGVGSYERSCMEGNQVRVAHFVNLVQQIPKGMLVYTMKSRHFMHWDEHELVAWGIRRAMGDLAAK
jgi:pimeloyl-ACP methyl ester carboxylesterase